MFYISISATPHGPPTKAYVTYNTHETKAIYSKNVYDDFLVKSHTRYHCTKSILHENLKKILPSFQLPINSLSLCTLVPNSRDCEKMATECYIPQDTA